MKIIRYRDPEGRVRHAGAALGDGDRYRVLEGDPLGSPRPTDEPARVAKLLAPVVPTQILCIGLNYRRHAEEVRAKVPADPVLFVKGVNALQHPGDPIHLPRHLRSDEVDYECELAVVIGRPCKNVTRAEALDFVAGYTCANDVSSRDWQITRGGGQWCRGKFFDTFAPLGPCLVTPDEIPDPQALRIRTELNGETVQDSNTSDMIFDVATLIAFLSGSTTLPPGTVILTGTPQGVGMSRSPQRYLRAGDLVTIEIEGIGRLTNPVLDEPIG
jgi:2-keto-4-pentenoate hydratase/2-oxohepta-3-ene-1,7-dioic acid hydratase in catechol pathway